MKEKNETSKDTIMDFSDLEDIELVGDSKTKDADEKKEKNVEEGSNKNKCFLYIIIDKNKPGMLTYMRERGLKVSKIFTNIASARDELVMQVDPFRLVVIDTGSGRFTSTANRKQIVDLVSLSDESIKVAVFYTDSILKIETSSKIKNTKQIEWFKYTNSLEVLAKLLCYAQSENFVYEKDKQEISVTQLEDVMNIKNKECSLKSGEAIDIRGFDGENLSSHLLDESTESIPKYAIKFKK